MQPITNLCRCCIQLWQLRLLPNVSSEARDDSSPKHHLSSVLFARKFQAPVESWHSEYPHDAESDQYWPIASATLSRVVQETDEQLSLETRKWASEPLASICYASFAMPGGRIVPPVALPPPMDARFWEGPSCLASERDPQTPGSPIVFACIWVLGKFQEGSDRFFGSITWSYYFSPVQPLRCFQRIRKILMSDWLKWFTTWCRAALHTPHNGKPLTP